MSICHYMAVQEKFVRLFHTPYYKYASDNSNEAMLYQYRKLNPEIATEDLIEYICKDVKNVIENL